MAKRDMPGVISVLFTPLVDRLISKALTALTNSEYTTERRDLEDELKLLDLKAEIVREYLEDAECKQLKDITVRAWIQELKDIAYDAEDLLDDFVTDVALLQIRGGIQSNLMDKIDCKSMLDKIKDININFTRLAEMKDDLGLQKLGTQTEAYRSGLRGTKSTSVLDSHIIGRDDVKKKITRLLTSNEAEHSSTKLPVIPIVGMGGVGKTALAQLVFHDDDVKKYFDLRIWVWVSQNFDPLTILRCIISDIEGYTSCLESLKDLYKQVQATLEKTKFLLMLDDAWNEKNNLWEQVLKPLRSGNKGSKVVVTTRSHRVAKSISGHTDPIDLGGLDDESIWNIMESCAFGGPANPTKHGHLIDIGKDIAKKLKGSPLAANAIGQLLSNEHGIDHWKRISTSELWELDSQDDHAFLPNIMLSYQHLSPELKQCFRLCSFFRKGYVIASKKEHPLRNDDNLCYMWMAHDIFHHKTGSSLEDCAREAINHLLSMSLFQESEDGFLTMHDLIHAISEHVARDDHQHIKDGVYPKNNPCKVRHLSISKLNWLRDAKMLDVPYRYEKLRTLLIKDIEDGSTACHNILNEWLERSTCLRVMDLSRCQIEELPNSFSNLKHIRYLDLHSTSISKLPESLTLLYNLQFLDLHYCRGLSELPDSIGNLINLRYLDLNYTSISKLPESLTSLHNLNVLRSCSKLSELPDGTTNLVNLRILEADSELIQMLKGIGRMTSLQELREFPVDRMRDWGIEQLENMDLLGGGFMTRGGLHIKSLENVAGADEAIKANLQRKVYLRRLILEWGDDSTDDGRVEEGVLEALQPSGDRLEYLAIVRYKGSVFPSWLNGTHLQKLKEIMLLNWKKCTDIPMEFPSSLLELSVMHFPLLSNLMLQNIPTSLKGLYIDRCGIEDESLKMCLSYFTSLQDLSLRDCPKLCEPLEKEVVIGCMQKSLNKLELGGGNWGFYFDIEQQYDSTWKLEIEQLEDSLEEATSARMWAWELLLGINSSVHKLEIRDCDIKSIDGLKSRFPLRPP